MTVIGLTTYAEPATMLVWQREFAMLHATYVGATDRAGAKPSPGVFGAVDVDIEPGTRTAELTGSRLRVSCHHHQALARLAPGLKVTGRADDGTVEAVEVPGRAFAVGVQWHPEEDSQDGRLFAALVEAGQQYRKRIGEGMS
jgi:anthranilate synthase component 2/putative glutamine amidotransferase